MARRDRDYEQWMTGFIAAGNKIEKEGLEAYKKELRNRNLVKVDIRVTEKQMNEMLTFISRRAVMNIMATALWVLYDQYEFRKKRLKKFQDHFEKVTRDVCDLDYLGQRYVRLEDFAVELNERYDLGIDVECVAACQDVYDSEDKNFGKFRTKDLLLELRNNGFEDAAVFIEKKLY